MSCKVPFYIDKLDMHTFLKIILEHIRSVKRWTGMLRIHLLIPEFTIYNNAICFLALLG